MTKTFAVYGLPRNRKFYGNLKSFCYVMNMSQHIARNKYDKILDNFHGS